MNDIERLDFTQGNPDLAWDNPELKWTSEPAVAWGDERPPEEDGTPRQRPIRFTFDGGDIERPCPSCGEDMNQWTPHHTCGGLTFLGTRRLEIDENGNLGEVKED
jgi:hypothetical protein